MIFSHLNPPWWSHR